MRRLLSSILAIALFSSPLFGASREPVRTRTAMVTSASTTASRVGARILRDGGNAVDAAIATALALAVTWPSAGNLGGGGFMLVRLADGTTEFIDYREVAPAAAKRTMYLDENGDVVPDASTVGKLSIAVPGTIAGLVMAHQRHGTLPWSDLVAPAIELAETGFVVNQHLQDSLTRDKAVKLLSSNGESSRIFLRDGAPWVAGDRFVQPELASTLKRIADDPQDFYVGTTASMIVEEMEQRGGLITAEDLGSYEAIVREPLRGSYRGYEILAAPPPSSGGATLLEMLNVLELTRVGDKGPGSAETIHVLSEVMKRAFADRNEYLGDPEFVEVPVKGMISKAYATEILDQIDFDKATYSDDVSPGLPMLFEESEETTHLSIVDGKGNAVSNTYTLNGSFGSGITVPGAGFLLNNEMDDFSSKPGEPNLYQLIQGEANAIAPRKRPLSSMTPTIVLKDGEVWLVVGSPGGPKIITTVLQVILNVIDFGMDIQEAVDAPRIHHQWLPDELYWEPKGLNLDTRRVLENRGHSFREEAKYWGDGQVVMVDSENGLLYGASDSRGGGYPVGY